MLDRIYGSDGHTMGVTDVGDEEDEAKAAHSHGGPMAVGRAPAYCEDCEDDDEEDEDEEEGDEEQYMTGSPYQQKPALFSMRPHEGVTAGGGSGVGDMSSMMMLGGASDKKRRYPYDSYEMEASGNGDGAEEGMMMLSRMAGHSISHHRGARRSRDHEEGLEMKVEPTAALTRMRWSC